MKILIATDMEGITGVVTWDHVTPGHYEYPRFRKLMTQDVNAAIEGAFEGGATEVIVADGHWDGANILIEELDPRAKLNTSVAAPLSMMQGIDSTIDGVMFVGYHARHGAANGILDHTWSRTAVANLWLNDILVGEFGLNGAIAGHFDVPVIMVTGDQTACGQTVELLGEMESVVVKIANGRYSAECLPPQVTKKMITDGARHAVRNLARGISTKPYKLSYPVKLTVDFKSSEMADRAVRMPGTSRKDLSVTIELKDILSGFYAFRGLVNLALS